jgi:hypothetical protein
MLFIRIGPAGNQPQEAGVEEPHAEEIEDAIVTLAIKQPAYAQRASASVFQ